MKLFLDIETIPTQRQDVCDYIEESMRDDLQASLDSVCAPANYKDEAKIAEYCIEKRAKLQAEFLDNLKTKIEATGLDGSFGQVFCIGWALDDGAPTTVYSRSERFVLQEFTKALQSQIPASERHNTTVIGHNVSSFDLRFLNQRFIVNGIRPPLVIQRAALAKPWESEKVFDTMIQWAGVGNRIKLDKLCLALSVTSPKGDMDGSKVWPMVQEERFAEIAAYCERDVVAVRDVYRRMTFATVLDIAPVMEDVPA